MAKGSSEYAAWLDGRRSPVNTGAPLPGVDQAQERVLHYQRKLHVWASNDAERRFRDLWNLVCDPATLVVAWSPTPPDVLMESRMRGNSHVRFGGRGGGDHRPQGRHWRPPADPARARCSPHRAGA